MLVGKAWQQQWEARRPHLWHMDRKQSDLVVWCATNSQRLPPVMHLLHHILRVL